jgi:MinD superfamily P-loop ATPase
MKEITILSGKGGTGKTSITAAFASLAKNAIFCDNDVDAADLHLILKPKIKEENTFNSGWQLEIDTEKCNSCNLCMEKCRFDAIHLTNNHYIINHLKCEGCRLCERICAVEAISSTEKRNNFWFVSDTRFGQLVHAKMGPGEENSGKLVTRIRKKAKEIAKENNLDLIINDGPPGIGCAAIASVTGTGKVILVIEPSQSGLHDAGRLSELVSTFNIPMFAIINKFDINIALSEKIEVFLQKNEIELLGKIPYDADFIQAMIAEKTIDEFVPDSETTKIIKDCFNKIL